MKKNKPLELLLRKFIKDIQYANLKDTKPFDGVFEVTDETGHTRRVLYILYLRQIERSANDPDTPPYICRNRLNQYKDEMLAIYSKMCDNRTVDERRVSIERLWRNPSNDIWHINNFFDTTFDNEALDGNHYSIESVDENDAEKPETIGLDIDNFDLDSYSIQNLRNGE